MTTPTSLDRFAAQLADAVLTGRLGPCIAGIPAGAEAPQVVPLDDGHPIRLLAGLRAPDHWAAVVVVTTGRVICTTPGPSGASVAPAGTAVVVAAVTERSGPDRSVVLDADGRVVLERSEVVGLVPDACRRFLGRPTAPPDVPVTAWWATDWLLDVAGALGAAGAGRSTLHDVVALHPAVELEELPAATADLVAFVVGRGWDHAHLTGWEGVRRSVADGLIVHPQYSPDLARWHDAGSFSRHAQRARPSPGQLLAAIGAILPTQVAAAVRRILVLWQLDPDR